MEIREGASEYEELADHYDELHPGQAGDLEFYQDLAAASEPPVLELACGTGRVTLPLARRGIPVVGLDRSPAMLDVARRKGQGIETVEWVEGDMRAFDLGRRFGLIVIPYGSFQHLLSVAEQQSTLAACYRHLLIGGRLAFDIFNPSIARIAAWMGELAGAQRHLRDYRAPGSGVRTTVWQSCRYRQSEQRLDELQTYEQLDRGGRVTSKIYRSLTLRYSFRYEIEHLLRLNGFEVEALYGWFDRSPFDERSTKMIWLARRPL